MHVGNDCIVTYAIRELNAKELHIAACKAQRHMLRENLTENMDMRGKLYKRTAAGVLAVTTHSRKDFVRRRGRAKAVLKDPPFRTLV